MRSNKRENIKLYDCILKQYPKVYNVIAQSALGQSNC